MLLPAVQMVREAARRAACQNNVKQIVLGLQNYHSAYERFPHGWNEQDGEGRSGWSWMAYNLPFVEQAGVYEQIDFELPVSNSAHEPLIRHRIETLFCPSSGDRNIGTFEMKGVSPQNLPPEDAFEFPFEIARSQYCLLYTSPSPRDRQKSRMPSSA